MKPIARPAVICLCFALLGGVAAAQDTLRAAAVVNDEVISILDVDMRVRLAVLSIGRDDRPELRRRILPQVMRTLIDERLQAQEAERLGIKVTDEQVNSAIERIASQNKMSRDDFLDVLRRRQILTNALEDQVRAQLTWQALVARRIRPTVEVTDEEIDEVVNRVASRQGTIQRLIAEIFLSVDSVAEDAQVRANAERLYEELRKGAPFAALARQFSESATAPRGGDLGWVEEGQLPPEIDRALAQMQPGTVTSPIRTLRGYHIIFLRQVRQRTLGEVTLDLKQILFAVPEGAPEAERQQAEARAADVRGRIDGCDGVDELAKSVGSPGSGDLGTVKLADLPEAVRAAVANLEIGQPSQPVAVGPGVSVLVVCDRSESGIDRERIKNRLMAERIDLLARRLMRDLRRAANVDIRI